ncbi:MAG: hypothetical protein N4Q30_06275, partial [Neisseriaceae bacterium]|nr:hypothetical protein [Neisseriaceae bacterium]
MIVKKRPDSPKPSKVATKAIDKTHKKPRVQTPPQKKKGPAQPAPKIRMPVLEAAKILQIYWPDLFDGDQLKPLQVGILNDLKADA